VWTCLPDGPCDYLSRQWVDFTGIPENAQLGYAWLEQIHPDDRERVQREWTSVVGFGRPFDIEFRIRRADGVHRWFRTRAIPLRDSDGAIVKWYGSNTDIDDYKKTEESLRISEERLRLAQDAARIGTFDWDLQTGISERTPELERMYGIEPGSIDKSRRMAELIHPEDRHTVLSAVDRAFEQPDAVETEWRVVWPDGSIRWLVGRFRGFTNEQGHRRLLGANIDITARKKEEERLEHLVAERTVELQAAYRELESFSYSVAHDLRTPLRGMNGFSRILLDEHAGSLNEEGHDFLRRIHESTVDMADLIEALLSLGRVTRTEIKHQEVNLSALAQSIASSLLRQERAVPVEVKIEDDIRARMDAALARVLLDNLLGNAWKFTAKQPKPIIEVGWSSKDGAMFVKDNGAGFNMEYGDKLFKPFQRLHSTKEFSGTGVGLATAYRIIERHGGRIWAEGHVGQGATMFFTVPSLHRTQAQQNAGAT